MRLNRCISKKRSSRQASCLALQNIGCFLAVFQANMYSRPSASIPRLLISVEIQICVSSLLKLQVTLHNHSGFGRQLSIPFTFHA